MCHITLSSVACLAPNWLIYQHDFQKKVVHKTRVTIFSTTFSETLFILKRNERDIMNVRRSSCKVPFILI